MAVAAQITLTPLNFHIRAPRSRPLFRRASLFFSFLWLAFSLFRCVTTFMHLLFLQKTCRLANRHTHTRKLTHTHTKAEAKYYWKPKFQGKHSCSLATGKRNARGDWRALTKQCIPALGGKKVINLNLIQIKICILWLKKYAIACD